MSTKVLWYQGQPGTSATTAFTADLTGSMDAATAHNPTAAGVLLQVWLNAAGGGASDSVKLYEATIAADATVSLPLVNHCIPKGGKVLLQADSAAAVTVTISGRKG